MKFEAIGHTDIGTTKTSNQDSYCIKIANTEIGQVALIAVADGMGGLQKGELASSYAINKLSDWFEDELPKSLEIMSSSTSGLESFLSGQWSGIVQDLNLTIMRYGRSEHMNLGTTLTVLLVVGARYSIVHVGDSRVYEISSKGKVKQLTEDQTYVHREIEAGRMTAEEAAVHPKRNVLLQCIGSSKKVEPELEHGNIKKNACYLVCSDGFRHELSDDQIASINFEDTHWEVKTKEVLIELTEYAKNSGESDNLTAAVLKVSGV